MGLSDPIMLLQEWSVLFWKALGINHIIHLQLVRTMFLLTFCPRYLLIVTYVMPSSLTNRVSHSKKRSLRPQGKETYTIKPSSIIWQESPETNAGERILALSSVLLHQWILFARCMIYVPAMFPRHWKNRPQFEAFSLYPRPIAFPFPQTQLRDDRTEQVKMSQSGQNSNRNIVEDRVVVYKKEVRAFRR